MRTVRGRWAALALALTAFVAMFGLAPGAALADAPVSTAEDLKAAVAEGGTVSLGADITVSDQLTIDKNVTLDLNGKTLTLSGQANVDVEPAEIAQPAALVNSGSLTIKNGTIDVISGANGIWNTGTLVVEPDAVVKCSDETFQNYSVVRNVGGIVTTAGTLESAANNGITTFGGTVNVTGGKISALYNGGGSNFGCALTIFNRNYDNKSAGAKVTISGGELSSYGYAASTNNLYSGGENGSSLTVTGGTLSSTITSIYWPSSGTLTIGSKGSQEGPTITSLNGSGIEVCSGTLNVYGGAISGGTAQGEDGSTVMSEQWVKDYRNHSGSASIGDAITVIARRGAGYVTASLSVSIEGGTFKSGQNYGVRYLDCNMSKDNAQLEQDAAVAISGGSFSGKIASVNAEFVPEAERAIVSGGTFSQAPDQAYLADGFTVFENADGSVSAVPEEDIFTVTFVDGEKKATVEVVDGTAVTAQPITEQPGYRVYWALDGKEFDFATPVTGDITLTAAKTLLPPTLTVESDSPAIVGDKVTISVAAESDAKVTYTYKWYGNGQLLNETSDTLSASAEGSYYVEVTATDADGQTATAQSNPVYVFFDGQVMYRLYNPYNGEHLYTADTLERDVLDNIGWNYEGIGWIAPTYDASTPVYRLNNPFAPLGDHHYTTSLVEYEACIEAGWEGEGIAWYSADEETGVPIYRQYNPFASSGTHNYTADENERDTLVDLGWKDEGVAWYALK